MNNLRKYVRSAFHSAIGGFLVAAATADLHASIDRGMDEGWSSLILTEAQLFGGLWIIGGRSPRWTQTLGTICVALLLAHDIATGLVNGHARPWFGRVPADIRVILGFDIALGLAFLANVPRRQEAAWLDSHPYRVALLWTLAGASGLIIDREHIGQHPVVGRADPGDSSRSINPRYLLYLPSGYHWAVGRWPLVLFLHGSAANGSDLERVKREGLATRAEQQKGFPFVLVAPQSLAGSWNPAAINELLTQILARYRIDPDRIYLTGLSRGGYGTWAVASAYPGRFAAIAPICGYGDTRMVETLRHVPTWAFHGAKDQIIPVAESRRLVGALTAIGGNVRLTVYPDAGHDSWTKTYDDPAFFGWLLRQNRSLSRRG